jgi:hypothetical protein
MSFITPYLISFLSMCYHMSALSSLYFVVTGIQYWSTTYMLVALSTPRVVVNTMFVVCAGTAPICGVFGGAHLIDAVGGYVGSRQRVISLKVCLALGKDDKEGSYKIHLSNFRYPFSPSCVFIRYSWMHRCLLCNHLYHILLLHRIPLVRFVLWCISPPRMLWHISIGRASQISPHIVLPLYSHLQHIRILFFSIPVGLFDAGFTKHKPKTQDTQTIAHTNHSP